MELTDRKKSILKAIVDAYIERGEPVGSKYLADHCGMGLSGATIRNIMAELEQTGLLEQPHTSAGRIPSTLGYRVYVDSLMESYLLTAKEVERVRDALSARITGMNMLLEQATKLLSDTTSLMSLSMAPKASTSTVTRFEAISLDPHNFLLILITSTNVVKTQYVHSNIEIGAETLVRLVIMFNEELAGKAVDSITLPVILKMKQRMGMYSFAVSPVLKIIYETLTEIDNVHPYIGGVNNLFKYPEYHDVEKAREIIELIDDKKSVADLLTGAAGDGISIYIGDERPITVQSDTGLILKAVEFGGQELGFLGLIGPKRMDYPKAVAMMEHLSGRIQDIIRAETDKKSGFFGE